MKQKCQWITKSTIAAQRQSRKTCDIQLAVPRQTARGKAFRCTVMSPLKLDSQTTAIVVVSEMYNKNESFLKTHISH